MLSESSEIKHGEQNMQSFLAKHLPTSSHAARPAGHTDRAAMGLKLQLHLR